MAMPARNTGWTVDMLDALEEDGQRYEIMDGELLVTPSPGVPHQSVVFRLAVRLDQYLLGSTIGKVMLSPSDVRRGDHSRNRLQPDIYVVRRVNGALPPDPYELGDLLLAVEVTSPGTSRADHQRKREIYLSGGRPEYWIVHQETRSIVRCRSGGEPNEIIDDVLDWRPAGMPSPFILEMTEFFEEALR